MNRYFHRNAITTGLTTAGAKKIARSTCPLLMRECTPSASARPTAFCTTTMKTVSSTVLRSAPKDWSSVKMRLKLSSPTKLAPPTPLQSVNA